MLGEKLARNVLLANATFSTFTGIACLLWATAVSEVLFLSPAEWIPLVVRLLGVGLIGFAAIVALVARSKTLSRFWTMQIVQADLAWVAGTALLVSLYGPSFTASGLWALWIVAAFVTCFAVGQYVGVKKLA